MTISLCKITKNANVRKFTLFVFIHISNFIWPTEMCKTSSWSSWQMILTSSLSFDSRINNFCVIKKNVSLLFLPTLYIRKIKRNVLMQDIIQNIPAWETSSEFWGSSGLDTVSFTFFVSDKLKGGKPFPFSPNFGVKSSWVWIKISHRDKFPFMQDSVQASTKDSDLMMSYSQIFPSCKKKK